MIQRGALLLLAGALPLATVAGDVRPHALSLEVVFPEGVGRESVRAEFERTLAWDLEQDGCFESVSRALPAEPGPADLRFRVTLVDVEDRTEWDVTLGQRDNPRGGSADEARRAVTVRLSVDLRFELLTVADDLGLRSKTLNITQGYRPRFNEDPRYEARNLVIEEAVRAARRWVCKPSAKELARQLDKARKNAGD